MFLRRENNISSYKYNEHLACFITAANQHMAEESHAGIFIVRFYAVFPAHFLYGADYFSGFLIFNPAVFDIYHSVALFLINTGKNISSLIMGKYRMYFVSVMQWILHW